MQGIKSPKLSILIPTYNYGRYLEETVDSVLAQDFKDYELIVSDDCSSDDTERVMSRYRDDGRVRYHRHGKNLGMVENWNWCLTEARGEYIKFVFGDDKIASSDGLGKLIALMEAFPSAALVASSRYLIDSNSDILETWNDLGKTGLYAGGDVIRRCLAEDRNLVGEPTVTLFRKKDVGDGFNTTFRQLVDLEFWFRLLAKGDLAYISEPLCCFRKHALQQSENNRSGAIPQIESIRLFCDHIHEFHEIDCRWQYFKKIHSVYKIKKNNNVNLDQINKLEEILSGKISRTGYAACWLLHRTKRLCKEFMRFVKNMSSSYK